MMLFPPQAREYTETLTNAVWTDQFDNRANRKAHFETTGPEIWEQTGKKYYGNRQVSFSLSNMVDCESIRIKSHRYSELQWYQSFIERLSLFRELEL